MALPILQPSFFDVGGANVGNYGAAVGQSLAQLGQQVGQQLAMREYQKQAATALPAMQSSFQSALSKIQSGDVSDGYIDLLNTQMQFGSTTNPFIQSAMANFSDLALKAGEMKKSELFRQAQYGGGTGGGTLPVMGPSGAEEARAAMMGQPMSQPMPQDMQAGGAEMLPEGTPIGGELPQGDAVMGEPMLTPGEPDFTQEPDEVQIDAANAAAQAVDATPEMQTKAVNALVANPKDSKIQWQNDKVEGLSALFPKSNLTDNIAIAPVGSTVEYSETWSGDTTKAGARFSGNKQVKVDDALNKKAVEYAGKLQESVSKLYNTGPTDTDQTWADVIKDAGGIQNLIPASGGEGDFSIRVKGKESLPVNQDTFEAFERVKGFSAFASRTGIKVMREGGEATADLRSRRFGSAEEADASGLPKGTIVYILRDGKYKKARID
jgi:hypothetical protein